MKKKKKRLKVSMDQVEQYVSELTGLNHLFGCSLTTTGVSARITANTFTCILVDISNDIVHVESPDERNTPSQYHRILNLISSLSQDGSQCNTDNVYQEEDEDQFIFFRQDDSQSSTDTRSLSDQRIRSLASHDVSSSYSEPLYKSLSVPCSVTVHFEKEDEHVNIICTFDLVIDIRDFVSYPRKPPSFHISTLRHIPRTYKTILSSTLDDIVNRWTESNFSDKPIRDLVEAFLILMKNLPVQQLKAPLSTPLCGTVHQHSDMKVMPSSRRDQHSFTELESFSHSRSLTSYMSPATLHQHDTYFKETVDSPNRFSTIDVSSGSSFNNQECHPQYTYPEGPLTCHTDASITPSLIGTPTFLSDSQCENPSTSRYYRDFDELEVLGIGGFGSVVLCKLRITGNHDGEKHQDEVKFAIKRIPLSLYSEKENQALQREAANLAILRHIHIVRYYCAWIETFNMPLSCYEKETCAVQKPQQMKRAPSKNILGHSCSPSTSGYIRSSKPQPTMENRIQMACAVQQKPQKTSRYLFIQMEYCSGQTLRKAIDGNVFYQQPDLIWTAFHQLLDGLAYMHSCGLIHRDLKPCNIFLQKHFKTNDSSQNNIHIKIGDFGLTTSIRESFAKNALLKTDTTQGVNLSAGVGTKFYMAPEQEKGGVYNDKADMFSLGIVFFELWHPPFNTMMERTVVLSSLLSPQRHLPEQFLRNVPAVVPVIILMLLSPSTHDRPSAQTLLESVLVPPMPAKGKFEQIYELLHHPTFFSETLQITRVVLEAQLRHLEYTCENPNREESLLAHDAEHSFSLPHGMSWINSKILTDALTYLRWAFATRKALRFECPLLFPRLKELFEHITPLQYSPSDTPNVLQSHAHQHHGLCSLDFHFETPFLDSYGTPVYIPSHLALGFSITAGHFLSLHPSISRRYAIQHVRNGDRLGVDPKKKATTLDHQHAIYEIGVHLLNVIDPNVQCSIRAQTQEAICCMSDAPIPLSLLLYLFRMNISPVSPQQSEKMLCSIIQQFFSFSVVCLFELEIMSVGYQCARHLLSLQQGSSQQGYGRTQKHTTTPVVYWSHGQLLCSLLWDIARIPPDMIGSVEKQIQNLNYDSSKPVLIEKLTCIIKQAQVPKQRPKNTKPGSGTSEAPDTARASSTATYLCSILTYDKGTVQDWAQLVRNILAEVQKCETLCVTELLLQHICYLDELIGSCITPLAKFIVLLPYNVVIYGKGLVFHIAKISTTMGSSSTDIRVTACERQTSLNGLGKEYFTVDQCNQGYSQNLNDSNYTGLLQDTLLVDAPHSGSNSKTSLGVVLLSDTKLLENRIATGGRYDYLVSKLYPDTSAGSTDFFQQRLYSKAVRLRPTGFFIVELCLQAMIDYSSAIPNALTTVTLPSGYATNKNTQFHSVPDTERKLDPRVLIIAVDVEQQAYAINLRRRLTFCGIPCQRYYEPSAEGCNFLRKTRLKKNSAYVVQIREKLPSTVSYRLHTFTPQEPKMNETIEMFDDEDKLVHYLCSIIDR